MAIYMQQRISTFGTLAKTKAAQCSDGAHRRCNAAAVDAYCLRQGLRQLTSGIDLPLYAQGERLSNHEVR